MQSVPITTDLGARISIRERRTTLCDKVCQWLAPGRWFSPNRSVSSTNKTDRHDITEILLKVASNTIKQTNKQTNKQNYACERIILLLIITLLLELQISIFDIHLYLISHDNAETMTTGRMMPSGINSPPVVVSTKTWILILVRMVRFCDNLHRVQSW
jgi:hypothetical protein